MPDVLPTLTSALVLYHVPPVVVLLNVVVVPMHIVAAPVIAPGIVLTLIVFVETQPPGAVYVITATPADNPATIPEVAPTVAMDVYAGSDQVPPEAPTAVSVVIKPTQIAELPRRPAEGLTVTVLVE